MFHRKNVDYGELIWEEFQYQTDYRKLKLRIRKIMPYPRFIKIIVNHFLSLHKSIPKGYRSGLNTIKDDGVIQRLKFVNKGEDFQEYGRAIPDTMLTDDINESEAYKAFIAYSTGSIPPKKTRGKWSQGKKQTVTPKKKSFISDDDNIIPKPNFSLELGKSISHIEAEIAKEERRLHETHENLVSTKLIGVDEFDEFDSEPANRPTEEEDHLVLLSEILQIKEALRLQQHTGDSSEGVGITPKVPDELTGKTSSEGASIVPEVLDDGKGSYATKADTEINLGSEDDSHQSDDEYVNEETDDERINSENGDQEIDDAEKNVVEKEEEEEKGNEDEEQADDD
ncbi:hypothetical protein Tco_1300175 [Tanacetum coccineum]